MTLYKCISLSPTLQNVITRPHHRGMLACFFQGLTCFLLASTSRSLQSFLRVLDGSMMSSTKPKFDPQKEDSWHKHMEEDRSFQRNWRVVNIHL